MAEFISKAEKKAELINDISEFSGFSLKKVKDNVEELSSSIGRNDKIFSTYTKHDISHINEMLGYLEWIIPPSAQEILTTADWLLITLSIYFHDLGMVSTLEEYDKRMENVEFTEFFEDIKSGNSTDFHARTKNMNVEEKNKFFFQEFIRKKHPTRIRKWINGSYKTDQAEELKKVGGIIEDTLSDLPSRFKAHLSTICESHHEDDLGDTEKYPLYQSYASNKKEATANVQYAALILRTVDLLHVTKDRTPSVMYKLINFTDPKSVAEWNKQSGTFSVDHKKRTFDPKNDETHVINISADFKEEEPFFSLSEYVTYANIQIQQTQQWAYESQKDTNAEKYWFPWKKVEGDLRVQHDKPEKLKFEFDRGSLLDLLVGHAIYNDPRVALRELMQNSIDAVRFQTFKDKKNSAKSSKSEIIVKWDPKTRLLIIRDNGIGMDRYTIQNHLMSVGSSYYSTSQFSSNYNEFNPISRFGIGILTCFMISDDIEIFTFKNNEGHRVKMKSVHGNYLLRSISASDKKVQDIKPHGTKIELQLRGNIDLTKKTILDILETWVVLPDCDVFYQEVGKEGVTKVGFNSTEEVLKSRLKRAGGDLSNTKVISKKEKTSNMTVHVSFAVSDYDFFASNFQSRRHDFRPILTLEGINVTNRIPLMNHVEPLIMVVSVVGSKDLRTTVSRAGLEKDQHFIELGKICLKLLYEHIRDEIDNIISSKGSPLSKASSIYNSLWNTLINHVSSKEGLKYLNEIRDNEKIIVIEDSKSDDHEDAKRDLISPNELNNMKEIWTTESRLIDSLGTISRDLGTELSLSKLLSSLDIKYHERFPFPMLPDAQLFTHDLYKKHIPESVEFSKEKQQTSIKWVLKDTYSCTSFNEIFNDIESNLLEVTIEKFIEGSFSGPQRKEFQIFKNEMNIMHVTEIKGDDHQVEIVQSRFSILFNQDSIAAETYLNLKKGLENYSDKFEQNQYLKTFQLLDILKNYSNSSYSQRIGSRANKEMENEWQRISNDYNSWMQKNKIDIKIPVNLEIFIREDNIFNVSHYWTNWLQGYKPI